MAKRTQQSSFQQLERFGTAQRTRRRREGRSILRGQIRRSNGYLERVFNGERDAHNSVVHAHGSFGGVFGDVRALRGPEDCGAESVRYACHDEEWDEVVGIMVENIGSDEKSVADGTDEHGDALTEQSGDGWRNKVRAGECKVQRAECVYTSSAALVDGRLQVLARAKGKEGERRGQWKS